MMTDIAVSTEHEYRNLNYQSSLCDELRLSFQHKKPSIEDIISMHTMESGRIIQAKYILTPTESGNTARRISRFKPYCWILAFTPNIQVARFLSLSYGVVPFMIDREQTDWYKRIMDLLKVKKLVKKDDYLILTEGTIKKKTGGTDSIRIISVD